MKRTGSEITANARIVEAGDPAWERLAHRLDEIWAGVSRDPGSVAAAASEIMDEARPGGNPAIEAKALLVRGGAYLLMLRTGQALQCFSGALALAVELEDAELEAESCLRIASLDTSLGEYASALDTFEKCFRALGRISSPGLEASCLNSMGELLRELGRYDEAAGYYEKALALARNGRLPLVPGVPLANLGRVHLAKGALEEASRYLTEAEASFLAMDDHAGAVETATRKAELLTLRGDGGLAAETYESILELVAGRPLGLAECEARLSYGEFLSGRGENAAAAAQYGTAFALAEASGLKKSMGRAKRCLSRTAAVSLSWREAYERLEESDRIERDYFDELFERRLGTLKIRYDLSRMEREAAEMERRKNAELEAKQAELERALSELKELADREREYKEMLKAWNERLESEVKRRTRDLEKLAVTDGLTGLYNHRHIFSLLEHEYASAVRYGRPLSVIMIDVDHFKAVNDSYGHGTGDIVLAETARAIRTALRSSDFSGRYGGEEFLAILSETGPDGAELLAERIRSLVGSLRFQDGKLTVTLSAGVATLSGEPTALALLETADKRLYLAKERGRDRVVHSDD